MKTILTLILFLAPFITSAYTVNSGTVASQYQSLTGTTENFTIICPANYGIDNLYFYLNSVTSSQNATFYIDGVSIGTITVPTTLTWFSFTSLNIDCDGTNKVLSVTKTGGTALRWPTVNDSLATPPMGREDFSIGSTTFTYFPIIHGAELVPPAGVILQIPETLKFQSDVLSYALGLLIFLMSIIAWYTMTRKY